jgi:hypothetical protein
MRKKTSALPYQAAANKAMRRRNIPNFTRVILTSEFNPGINISMTETFTAFEGLRRLASGPLTDIAPSIKHAEARAAEPISVFSDATGRAVDLDLRGSVNDVLARLAKTNDKTTEQSAASEPRGRGRPKLGVVAREVTLLPRHWEWLNAQPGGASVALRKLVEAARRNNGDADRLRAARDAAYHFMSAMAGNLANFEEASRALFADDRRRFISLIAAWPADIREHVTKLAYADAA